MATLAQSAGPVFLISPWKPVLVLLALVGWGWVISFLDKDAAYFYLNRYWWNMGQMACGIIGFGLMLLIPIFGVGLVVGLLVLGGGVFGYAYYRNTRVPDEAQWNLSLDSFRNRLTTYQREQAQKKAELVLLHDDDTPMDVPTGDDPRVEAHQALENVIDFAVPRGADYIRILVSAEQARMVAHIDGVDYPRPDLEPRTALAMIDYLKQVAGLDVEEHRKKQEGTVKLNAGELGLHKLDLETSGSTRGRSMVLTLDAEQRKQMPLTHLGLLDSQKQQIQQLVEQPDKVVLVSAPEGQGVTTTTYSLLQEHDPYTSNIVTLERDVTLELEGVSHNELATATPQQFNEKLAATIRTDPNVMLLSHLADASTASLVAQAAEDLRFYIAMRENDTFTALAKWIKLVGSRKTAGNALGAILTQRLIRKLCMTCRTPFKPDPEALRKRNLPVNRVDQLYRASGQVMEKDKAVTCPDCMGMGYKGRIGVFEMMIFDDQARSLVAAGDLDKLRSHLRKQKMMWLNEAGLAKVVEGVTDIKEVSRTLGESSKKKSSSRSKSKKKPAASPG